MCSVLVFFLLFCLVDDDNMNNNEQWEMKPYYDADLLPGLTSDLNTKTKTIRSMLTSGSNSSGLHMRTVSLKQERKDSGTQLQSDC